MAEQFSTPVAVNEAWAEIARIAAEAQGLDDASVVLESMLAHRGARSVVDAGPELVPARLCLPAIDEDGVVTEVEAEVRRRKSQLSRQQRRVMRRRKEADLDKIAIRYVPPKDEQKGGVWSREMYRRIRAGVQDPSGRAAECLLYMLGTHEAAELAEHLDPRVPMDRRIIAFLYALACAPSNSDHNQLKLGLPLGLFSKVLADPNNANLSRARRYQPSRRTLSTDLDRLEQLAGLRRWQVPPEAAAAVEMKDGAKHPTNRYWVSGQRDAISMWLVAVALGDIVPEHVTPDDVPSREDGAATTAPPQAACTAREDSAPPGPS